MNEDNFIAKFIQNTLDTIPDPGDEIKVFDSITRETALNIRAYIFYQWDKYRSIYHSENNELGRKIDALKVTNNSIGSEVMNETFDHTPTPSFIISERDKTDRNIITWHVVAILPKYIIVKGRPYNVLVQLIDNRESLNQTILPDKILLLMVDLDNPLSILRELIVKGSVISYMRDENFTTQVTWDYQISDDSNLSYKEFTYYPNHPISMMTNLVKHEIIEIMAISNINAADSTYTGGGKRKTKKSNNKTPANEKDVPEEFIRKGMPLKEHHRISGKIKEESKPRGPQVPHVRKAHWRNHVVVGPNGEKTLKKIWIPARVINGEKGKLPITVHDIITDEEEVKE